MMDMALPQKILSDITVFTKYARYIPSENRRETWQELCDRNMHMHIKKFPNLEFEIRQTYRDFVVPKKVLPSMRSMQFAGRPIELSNARIYNCAFLPANSPEAFNEVFFLLLSGTGVGYSVQRHHVNELPKVVGSDISRPKRFLITDSIEGWADAVKVLMKSHFFGRSEVIFDYSDIRAKGEYLKTSGGKAPGHGPLKLCLEKIRETLIPAKGRRLSTIEVHDILCHISDAVLAGGIRRAAMIALFSYNDDDMLNCKSQLPIDNWELERHADSLYHGFVVYKGKSIPLVCSQPEYDSLIATKSLPWYFFEPQRGRANNSVVLHRKHINKEDFDKVWKRVESSRAGEPGIFWTNDYEQGTNPCAEISLSPFGVCNLSEVNVSNVINQQDLNARVKAAAFICTLQATYTDFHYLRFKWKETAERDALIGVGMTGIASNAVADLSLQEAAEIVKVENERVAKIVGINPAARCTTIKPSGTTSCVLGTSSGIHAWHAPYYVRRMRLSKIEPLYNYVSFMLPDLVEDDKFKPDTDGVLSLPQMAPENATTRSESFMDLLNRVKKFNIDWVFPGHRRGENKNNVSCTISLKDDEWKECGDWMFENRNLYSGISVLPYDGGTYVQAPFEEIDKDTYDKMCGYLSKIDLSLVTEVENRVNFVQELACAGAMCEIV